MAREADDPVPVDLSAGSPDAPIRSAGIWLKRILPWCVTAGIFYYLFTEVPIADAWESARGARLERFLPAMFGAVLVFFLVDSQAFSYLFTRFNARLSWAEARSLRGMTYLITPINWNLGTAAVILHLRASKKIDPLESTSTMFFYQTIDGIVLTGLALLGVSLMPESPEIAAIRRFAIWAVAVQVAMLALAMASVPGWIWLRRLRGFRLFRTHQRAGLGNLGAVVGLKTVYFFVFVAMYWLACDSFGIDLPVRVAIAATPAILMFSSLPITPGGLGTTQAAMLYFFAPYGDEASILACGLTLNVALLLFRFILGLGYIRDLSRIRSAPAT